MGKKRRSKERRSQIPPPPTGFVRVENTGGLDAQPQLAFRVLGAELGCLLAATPGPSKLLAAHDFRRKLYAADPDGYAAVAKGVVEDSLHGLLELAQTSGQPELEQATKLVFREAAFLGIGSVTKDMMTATSDLRYRLACGFLEGLSKSAPDAAYDFCAAALSWVKEQAKQEGMHAVVADVDRLGDSVQTVCDNWGRLASTKTQ